jgi:hypothetical protein
MASSSGTGFSKESFRAVESKRCHELGFASKFEPQWRDRIVLKIAADLNYTVKVGCEMKLSTGPLTLIGSDDILWTWTQVVGTSSVGPRREKELLVAGEVGGPVLYWQPFYALTSGRRDLHPLNPFRSVACSQDCPAIRSDSNPESPH